MTKDSEATVLTQPNRRFAVVIAGLAILIIALSSAMIVSGMFFAMKHNVAAGLTLIVVGSFMGLLGLRTWGEAVNAWCWRMIVTPAALQLRLPRGRSYLHNLKRYDGTIQRTSVAAIVFRLEGYKSLGMANLNRVFALRLADGTFLHIGEDRALATRLHKTFHHDCVTGIAAQLGLPLVDFGVVTASGGFLGVLGADAPAWNAASADKLEASNIWHRARRTGAVMMWVVWAVLLVQALEFLL